MLTLETLNRKAFDYYNAAIRKIDLYSKTLEPSLLEAASSDLDSSISADGNFFRAANYKGIVYDIMGKAQEAILQFDTIVQNTPDSIRGEVLYNTAIANYHLYHEANLTAASELLDSVIRQYSDNIRLRLLATASLAQCKGMMELHAVNNRDLKKANELKNKVNELSDQVLNEVSRRSSNKELEDSLVREVSWIVYNAKGIAVMYLNDHLRDERHLERPSPYLGNLKEALKWFQKAREFAPLHWAIACNIASAEMRMGYWYAHNDDTHNANAHFKVASDMLDAIVQKLKPGYDFAYYEKGRVYRFWGKFDEAKNFLNKAKGITGLNKSVSSSTIQKQIDLADLGDSKW